MSFPMYVVDAFTDKPFSGNPAAVCVLEEALPEELMQAIAMENNLSETAFVYPLGKSRYHIRWFTPWSEVALCGHATLATSFVLFNEGLVSGDIVEYQSKSGVLSVVREAENLVLNFPLQPVGPVLDVATYAALLGVSVKHAVQAYDDILLELPSEKDVVSFQANNSAIMDIHCRGLIITAKADGRYDFISRFFAPELGVVEDPVTGSAHCKLADYWSKHLNKTQFTAYQASPRGGELALAIEGERVLIKGQAVMVMKGQFCA